MMLRERGVGEDKLPLRNQIKSFKAQHQMKEGNVNSKQKAKEVIDEIPRTIPEGEKQPFIMSFLRNQDGTVKIGSGSDTNRFHLGNLYISQISIFINII